MDPNYSLRFLLIEILSSSKHHFSNYPNKEAMFIEFDKDWVRIAKGFGNLYDGTHPLDPFSTDHSFKMLYQNGKCSHMAICTKCGLITEIDTSD